jgi:uncharacterized protein (TIGR03435 family)
VLCFWHPLELQKGKVYENYHALFLSTLATVHCFAQAPAVQATGAAPRFEVASVRLAGDESRRWQGRRIQTEPGSLATHGLTLRACILWAYQQPVQIVAPDWISGVALDIVAKAATPVGDDQLYLMLRTLLEERMGMKAHFEKREIPVYAMTIAKGGAKFTKSTTDGPLSSAPGKDGSLNLQHFSMTELATEFSRGQFDRPVVDATGLKGRYDAHIDMSTIAAANRNDPMEGVSAFITSMEEQLGLKIEARKEMVDVLVVDHVEKTPTEN